MNRKYGAAGRAPPALRDRASCPAEKTIHQPTPFETVVSSAQFVQPTGRRDARPPHRARRLTLHPVAAGRAPPALRDQAGRLTLQHMGPARAVAEINGAHPPTTPDSKVSK